MELPCHTEGLAKLIGETRQRFCSPEERLLLDAQRVKFQVRVETWPDIFLTVSHLPDKKFEAVSVVHGLGSLRDTGQSYQ